MLNVSRLLSRVFMVWLFRSWCLEGRDIRLGLGGDFLMFLFRVFFFILFFVLGSSRVVCVGVVRNLFY